MRRLWVVLIYFRSLGLFCAKAGRRELGFCSFGTILLTTGYINCLLPLAKESDGVPGLSEGTAPVAPMRVKSSVEGWLPVATFSGSRLGQAPQCKVLRSK
jgi:hypothetical protein